MGGKTATSSQQVQIPPSVLAQYQSVNNRATDTAQTPFQQYGGEFVAPFNATQNQGAGIIEANALQAQPYFVGATNTMMQSQRDTAPTNNAALGLAGASAEQVNPTALDGAAIQQYMSPYLQTVLGSESNVLNQNNQQQQAGQLGNAISSGAFGGDRAGIAAANLEEQQNLANSNIYSNILNTGYNNALQTAQQQQGVGLAAGQANRAALASAGNELAGIGQTAYGEGANTATTLAGLGTGAQTASLQGGSAELQAGTAQQQTEQAQDTALYNQFLQQQSYPFQVDQFLANIAEGTGALSGSTTTTQQPGGFFSDERLKEDARPVGKTFDGQTIYSYRMKGDPRTRMGLMAGEVEKKHPKAVGLEAGYKTVDYGKATERAANEGHFASGGVVPFRAARAVGGDVSDPYGIQSILDAQRQMYAPPAQQGRSIPNQGSGGHQLAVASGSPAPPPSGASNVQTTIGLGNDAYRAYHHFASPAAPTYNGGTAGQFSEADLNQISSGVGHAADQAVATPGVGGGTPVAASDTAGLSAANTAAGAGAADAGASGAAGSAASAAGAGAAEAGATAAAGAAGSAAAGAAGDAAATEAAALAADYVAGDAAVALLAAKRGGRIGLAAGGMPYDPATGATPYQTGLSAVDIPDTENSNKLQTAGPIKKQPTGLQTLMMMGNPQDWGSIAGSTFSNQGLGSASGGRIHKDDGGGLDPDVASLPEATVESSKPPPVTYTGGVGLDVPVDAPTPKGLGAGAASAETPATPDPVADADKKTRDHWYNHAENIIPLVTGLAAMGTAPTRSWGTALAAGLGAGAQAYLPAQKQAADTSLVQQKARAEKYQADLAGAANPYALSILKDAANSAAVSPASPVSVPSGAPSSGGNTSMPLVNQLRQKYANPPILPEEAQKIQQSSYLSAVMKNPAWLESAKVGPQNRVAQTDYQNKLDARSNYDDAIATYRATKDTNPALAASAAATADAYQQFTGDEAKVLNGVQLNGRTMEPYIGTQAQRLSPEAYTTLASSLRQLDTVPAGDPNDPDKTIQVPHYKRIGYDSVAQAIAGLVPSGTPDVPGAAAAVPTGARPTPVAAAAPRNVAPSAAPRGAQSTESPVAPPPTSVLPAPVAVKAFADPKFFPARAPNQPGTTFGASTKITAEAAAKRRAELQDVASDTSASAGAAMQYALAAKKILDSKGAPVTGFYGPLAKAISAVAGTANASNYEEVSKQLGNLAIQAGKGNFPNATQKEVGLQFEQLSPATTQQGPALRRLVDETIRINQYALDSAKLATDYIDKGGNVMRFGEWNQQYHPRADAVNTVTAPPVGTVRGPYRFKGGDAANRANWPKR